MSFLLQKTLRFLPYKIRLSRNFGRGQKPNIFGHRPSPHLPTDYLLVFFASMAPLFIIDWKKILNYYGYNESTGFFKLLFPDHVAKKSDSYYELHENSERIKNYLRKQVTIKISDEKERDEMNAFIDNLNVESPEFIAYISFSSCSGDKCDRMKEKLDKLLETNHTWRVLYGIFPKLIAEENKSSELIGVYEVENNSESSLVSSLTTKEEQIKEYENRLRQFSTPDKTFRYFATMQVVIDNKSEIMMTPQDFLRSLTPGEIQPRHLRLDHYITIGTKELKKMKAKKYSEDKNSIFYHLGSGGLISFSDYIFLLTVLSTSRKNFTVAFKMFDLNGDGNVDVKEFKFVSNLMLSQSNIGKRRKDRHESNFKGVNSGLINYFFGKDNKNLLTIDKFLEFQKRLQNEISILEFKQKMNGDGQLSASNFAELLMGFAGFNSKKKNGALRRISKKHKNIVISFQDYINFNQLLYSINEINAALTYYHLAGESLSKSLFKHVAYAVAKIQLSDHVIDVVYAIFDENRDDKLSKHEFISVMKKRINRGLEKPKDTGLLKTFKAIHYCGKKITLANI